MELVKVRGRGIKAPLLLFDKKGMPVFIGTMAYLNDHICFRTEYISGKHHATVAAAVIQGLFDRVIVIGSSAVVRHVGKGVVEGVHYIRDKDWIGFIGSVEEFNVYPKYARPFLSRFSDPVYGTIALYILDDRSRVKTRGVFKPIAESMLFVEGVKEEPPLSYQPVEGEYDVDFESTTELDLHGTRFSSPKNFRVYRVNDHLNRYLLIENDAPLTVGDSVIPPGRYFFAQRR